MIFFVNRLLDLCYFIQIVFLGVIHMKYQALSYVSHIKYNRFCKCRLLQYSLMGLLIVYD